MEFQQAGIAVKRLGDIMNAPVEPVSLVPQRGRAEGGNWGTDHVFLTASHTRRPTGLTA